MALNDLAAKEIFQNIDPDLDTLVGFSGGPDSTALLFGLHQLKINNRLNGKLAALHINHGINSQANAWESHCKQVAESLGITFFSEHVTIKSKSKSIEIEARNLRMEVFKAYSRDYKQICLAHHLDDQVETVLFRLFRGTGLRGITGIKLSRKIGEGFLIRPLLHAPKDVLIDYLTSHNIDYLIDESNLDQSIDRNFIRKSVMPLIQSRWSAAANKIFDFSKLAHEEIEILDTLFENVYGHLFRSESLIKSELVNLDSPLRRKLIRHWLEFHKLPIPNLKILIEIEKTFLDSSSPNAEVQWSRSDAEQGVILRINKNEIYFEVI